jgi:hypothetical protein
MMLSLYRGLVDILTDQCEKLNSEFIKHIRKFNDGETADNNFGVKGFWNLLLEVVYILYVKLFVATGIVLTISLAITFFPLHALRVAFMNIMNHRAEPFPTEYNEPKEK